MKDYNVRVKRLELRTGTVKEKVYAFVHLGYYSLDRSFKNRKFYVKKVGFTGAIQIWENLDKQYRRNIDIDSKEGFDILRDHGYEIIYPNIGQIQNLSAD